MDVTRKWEQYDRFLEQVRFEAKQIQTLYYFFYAIEAALLGAIFIEKIELKLIPLASVVGIGIAVFALKILDKQKTWRKRWIEKMKKFEKDSDLNFIEEYKLWDEKGTGIWDQMDYIFLGFIGAFIIVLIV